MKTHGLQKASHGRILTGLERGLIRWHLLSLDAPTVAAVWTWFVARCAGVALPAVVPAAMFLAVWLLYAADRLLDGRGVGRDGDLEERHRFHRAHRRRFGTAMVLGIGLLLPLVVQIERQQVSAFWPFMGLGVALGMWFGVIHLARPLGSLQGPKELAPGLFFGAAVFLPTLVRAPGLRPWLEMAAAAFGLVCWLNCRMIFRWEHASRGGWTRGLGLMLGGACVGLAAVQPGPTAPVLLAVSLATAGLLALDHFQDRLSRTTLRAAADLVLLTPLLLAWIR